MLNEGIILFIKACEFYGFVMPKMMDFVHYAYVGFGILK